MKLLLFIALFILVSCNTIDNSKVIQSTDTNIISKVDTLNTKRIDSDDINSHGIILDSAVLKGYLIVKEYDTIKVEAWYLETDSGIITPVKINEYLYTVKTCESEIYFQQSHNIENLGYLISKRYKLNSKK